VRVRTSRQTRSHALNNKATRLHANATRTRNMHLPCRRFVLYLFVNFFENIIILIMIIIFVEAMSRRPYLLHKFILWLFCVLYSIYWLLYKSIWIFYGELQPPRVGTLIWLWLWLKYNVMVQPYYIHTYGIETIAPHAQFTYL